MLTERNGEVRSIDIATEMGVTKPSVSIAMKNLRQAGYISMDGAGYITLEPPGLEIATRIYGRHKKLTRFLLHWVWTLSLLPTMPARSSMT